MDLHGLKITNLHNSKPRPSFLDFYKYIASICLIIYYYIFPENLPQNNFVEILVIFGLINGGNSDYGSICLILYYSQFPEELLKINIFDILAHFGILAGILAGTTLVTYIIFNKITIPLVTTGDKYLDNCIQNIVAYKLMEASFFEWLLVMGEDSLFMINFIPKYKSSILLKLITAIIFGTVHMNTYSLLNCVSKMVGAFVLLNYHTSLVNLNISHFLVDYLVFLLAKYFYKSSIDFLNKNQGYMDKFIDYIKINPDIGTKGFSQFS